MGTFDYAYWRALYERDPKQFEKERSAAIEQLILTCKEENQQSLRKLQWRIDGIRRRHGVEGALVEIQQLMHESEDELTQALSEVAERLEQLSEDLLALSRIA